MNAGLTTAPAAGIDDQHRQVLTVLRPRLIGAQLEAALGLTCRAPAGGAPAGTPQRRVLDAKYRPGEHCTILYQLGDALVVGTLQWGEAAMAEAVAEVAGEGGLPADDRRPTTDDRRRTGDGGRETAAYCLLTGEAGRSGGAMRAYLFPDDPALPGLATALRPEAMAQALAQNLAACRMGAARVLRCRVSPVRYRPDKRCTLRVDVWLRDARTGTSTPQTLFGKVYHDLQKAAAVYRAMQALADAAPVRDGRLVVPRAVALVPQLPMVLQEAVEGTPLDLFLGPVAVAGTPADPRGRDGLARAARALAALHTVDLPGGRPRPMAAELATLGQRAAQIALVDRALGGRTGELLTALAAWSERLPAGRAETGLIHGDCKPSQFLLGAARVALLDLDHCGVGDPAADVGTFLATLRQMGIRGTLDRRGRSRPSDRWRGGSPGPAAAAARGRSLQELAEQFLAEYCAASGRGPDFRPRVAWHEAVALIRKAQRAFARSPRSPLPAALVEGAWHCYATSATLSGADRAAGRRGRLGNMVAQGTRRALAP
jgi:aminoglycoside phosphotransferase (APT) family kinase protein